MIYIIRKYVQNMLSLSFILTITLWAIPDNQKQTLKAEPPSITTSAQVKRALDQTVLFTGLVTSNLR